MIKQLITLFPMLAVAVNNGVLNVELDLANANIQYSQNINELDEYNYYMKSTNNTERNSYCDIHTNNYSGTYLNSTQYTSDRYKMQNIYIAQITPYNQIANTTINLHAHLNIQYYGGNPSNQLDSWISAYTTKADLTQFIDRNDWSNQTSQTYYENIFNYALNLPNSNNEWIEQAEEYPTPIDENGKDIDVEGIRLDSFETIYIVYWIEVNINSDLVDTSQQMTTYINSFQLTADIVEHAQTVEVVDIPGLMFSVLTMPFAFISQAFNLTLFAGTAYQINIGQLFLGLIGVAILLWVLKLILGRVDLGGLLADSKAKRDQLRTNTRDVNRHKEKMDAESKRHERAMQRNAERHANKQKERKGKK